VPGDVVSGKLLRSLDEGQPVHMNVIVEEDKGEFLAANMQKGMRGVGIEVKKHVVADRLIKPGNFVDVLVTYRVRVNTKGNPEAQSIVNRYATETVIENVRVLAIDDNDKNIVDVIEEDGSKDKKNKASKKVVVTLEVNPDEAEKLLLAYKMGDIGLSLRSIGDIEQPKTDKNVTDVGLSRVMTRLTKLTGASSAVRIYSGANMSEERGRAMEPEKNGVEFDVEEPLEDQEMIMLDPTNLGGMLDE
jgi:pilus assembly protein CpaB